MRLKKTIAAVTVTILAGCMCACGALPQGSGYINESGTIIPGPVPPEERPADMESIRMAFDSASGLVAQHIDVSKMTADDDTESESALYRYWYDENAPWNVSFSGEISLAGIPVVLGQTTVGALKEAGLSVSTAEDTVQPGESVSITVEKDGKTAFLQLITNTTEQALPVDGFTICGFTAGDAEFTIPYEYAGITSSSSFEEAVRLFGVPNAGIRLAAETYGTYITLSYYNGAQADGYVTDNSMEIDFAYDAETGSTSVYGLRVNTDTYQSEVGE